MEDLSCIFKKRYLILGEATVAALSWQMVGGLATYWCITTILGNFGLFNFFCRINSAADPFLKFQIPERVKFSFRPTQQSQELNAITWTSMFGGFI